MKNGKEKVKKTKDMDAKSRMEKSYFALETESERTSKLTTPKHQWNCNYLLNSYLAI